MGGILGHAANMDGKLRKPHKSSGLWPELFSSAHDIRILSKAQTLYGLTEAGSSYLFKKQEPLTFAMTMCKKSSVF